MSEESEATECTEQQCLSQYTLSDLWGWKIKRPAMSVVEKKSADSGELAGKEELRIVDSATQTDDQMIGLSSGSMSGSSCCSFLQGFEVPVAPRRRTTTGEVVGGRRWSGSEVEQTSRICPLARLQQLSMSRYCLHLEQQQKSLKNCGRGCSILPIEFQTATGGKGLSTADAKRRADLLDAATLRRLGRQRRKRRATIANDAEDKNSGSNKGLKSSSGTENDYATPIPIRRRNTIGAMNGIASLAPSDSIKWSTPVVMGGEVTFKEDKLTSAKRTLPTLPEVKRNHSPPSQVSPSRQEVPQTNDQNILIKKRIRSTAITNDDQQENLCHQHKRKRITNTTDQTTQSCYS